MGQSNQMSAGEACVVMLKNYGVDHVFGLCGDTSLPLYDAFRNHGAGITHFLTRDERHASYMADSYARISGKVGVCEGPSGGGATYMLPGLVEAHESSIPLLGITTDVSTASRGRYPLTELDQKALFAPVTKWNATIDQAAALPGVFRAAFRAMTSDPCGAAHICLPIDVLRAPVDDDEVWCDRQHGFYPRQRRTPDQEEIEAAVDILLLAKKAVMICGGGPVISDSAEAIAALAARLNLPIATSVSGQGAIAETSPYAVGVVGSNGGVSSTRHVIEEADTVIFVGCRTGSVTTERWRFPGKKQTIIHIDTDPAVFGVNYPRCYPVYADARLAIEAILQEFDRREGAIPRYDGQKRAQQANQIKWEDFNQHAANQDGLIRPESVIAALQKLCDQDAIICADPGTPCPYVSAYYRWPREGRHFISNRAHGALGYALPAAFGAHVAKPDRQVLALLGDGSFGFCCGELETILRYRAPIKIIVFNNGTYGWIKAGQKTGFDQRYYNVDFSTTDHAAVAAAFGIKSWRVESIDQLEPALKAALADPGPCLVDVVSQPLHEAHAPVSEWIA